jgi:hypothetical protein
MHQNDIKMKSNTSSYHQIFITTLIFHQNTKTPQFHSNITFIIFKFINSHQQHIPNNNYHIFIMNSTSSDNIIIFNILNNEIEVPTTSFQEIHILKNHHLIRSTKINIQNHQNHNSFETHN